MPLDVFLPKLKMKVHVDVSGRINQWNCDSFFAICSVDDKELAYAVMIDNKTKKKLRKRYGKITDFVEKMHCACLFHLMNPHLGKLSYAKICMDIDKKKLSKYLKDYLSSTEAYDNFKKDVEPVGKTSPAHKYLKKMDKKSVNHILKFEEIMKFLEKEKGISE